MNPPRTKANKHNNSMQNFSNVGANPHPKTFLFWLKANEEGQNAGSNNDRQCAQNLSQIWPKEAQGEVFALALFIWRTVNLCPVDQMH